MGVGQTEKGGENKIKTEQKIITMFDNQVVCI